MLKEANALCLESFENSFPTAQEQFQKILALSEN